ncbi:MAG: dTDP-4-dehydrorhamnose 3,5-epimerase family protein [Candidatus Methanomethyliaceae archaeon]
MRRFNFEPLSIEGLIRIIRHPMGDSRGFLERLFCAKEFAEVGWRGSIAQINRSYTLKRGTIRGIHFQYPPYSEKKVVICVKGEVWDIVVDIRKGSPTFLAWHGELLSENKTLALLIPEGCAHGFQTLTDDVEMLYFHSAFYAPEFEGGLNPLDPRLSIRWPVEITEISERDRAHPCLNDDFEGIEVKV